MNSRLIVKITGLKNRLILVLIAIILVYVGYWFFTHSRIEFGISNFDSGSTAALNLYSTSKAKDNRMDIKTPSFKKIVGKDSYEINLTQNNTSFFGVIKTGSFLQTTKVDAELQTEKARQFVGNDPSECMEYLFSVLYSYSCGDFYANIKAHQPATESLPTLKTGISASPISGNVEGFVWLEGTNFVLIQSRFSEEKPSDHYIYKVNEDLSLSNSIKLAELNPDSSYSIEQYKNGFLAYDSALRNIFYYERVGANATSISVQPVGKNNLSAVSLSVSDNFIITLYTEGGPDKGRSVIVVTDGTNSKNYEIKKRYAMATLCGDKSRLCALGSNKMGVYDLSSDKPKLLYELDNVSQINGSEKGFLVVNKTGVLNFDTISQSGFYEYSFGDYKFNYIELVSDGYILNLTNNKDNKVAVLVNHNVENTDGIDKKISSLQKLPEVKFVNVYGKYIYVSGGLGERSYNPELSDYIYNPETKKAVAEKINKEIDRLGIDRNVYTISSNAF